MGFSKQDLEEQQALLINLDHIRFGHRVQHGERLNVPFQGVRLDSAQGPKRPPKEQKPEPPPTYDTLYQRRLW